MIPEELKKLIDKYCKGITPSKQQEDEINDKVFELGADPIEVYKYIESVTSQKSDRQLEEEEADRQRRLEEAREQVATLERTAQLAAYRAESDMAQAEVARQNADEARSRLQSEIDNRRDRKNKKRTYVVSAIILALLAISIGVIAIYLNTGRTAAEYAAQSAYNIVNKSKGGNINEIEVNTNDVESDDPSITIDPSKDIKSQLLEHYDVVYDLYAGFYKIKKYDKFGLADSKGKIIQRPKYDNIMPKDKRGLMKVEQNHLFGYLNINGVEVVEPAFNKIYPESDGLIKVSKGNYFGFLNASDLSIATPCEYTFIYSLSENKYKVEKNGKVGYLNMDGSILIECK